MKFVRLSVATLLVATATFAMWNAPHSVSAVGTVIFSDDFSSFGSGGGTTDVGSQASTGFTLGAFRNMTGWTKSGTNSVHGVDRDNTAGVDWAPSFYYDNAIEMSTGISANANGAKYTVSFDLGPSVYSNTSQATRQSDGIAVSILRADGTTLATQTHMAGVWDWSANAQALTRRSLSYTGDGSGLVKLRFAASVAGNAGRFGGAIDNVEVRTGDDCDPASTTVAGATVLSFTTIGTCTWVVPANVSSIRSLVVAGGGGGGGGGGGAGGLVETSSTSVTPGASITITVGRGGVGASKTGSGVLAGTDGQNSVFGSITADGGGGGGAVQSAGRTGGSSGGAGQDSNSAATSSSQGFSGAPGRSTAAGTGAGGGGGAGAVGIWGHLMSEFPDQRTMGGNGGAGVTSTITGATVGYAGGGGGGANNNASPTADRGFGGGGASNIYGAGDGSYSNTGSGLTATPNTGSGGGGGDWEGGGGNGASGIVVLRFTAVAPSTTTSTTTTTTTTTSTTTTSTSTTTTTTVPTSTAAPVSPATTVSLGQASVATIVKSVSSTTAAPSGLNTQKTTSASSVAPTTTQPQQTVPSASDVAVGEATSIVDGQEVPATVTRENNQIVITSSGSTARLSSLQSDGAVSPLDSEGNLVLEKGGSVGLSVLGFAADSEVEVWIFSTPTRLGSTTVAPNGESSASLALPASLEVGKHRLVMTGLNSAGQKLTTTVGVVLGEKKSSAPINVIAISLAIALAIFGALFLPAAIRRRRSEQ